MFVYIFRNCVLVTGAMLILFSAAAQKNRRNKDNTQRQSELAQAEYYFTEGMKYFVLENYTKAADYFQKSLEINNENAGANYAIAQAMSKTNGFANGIPYAEKAVKLTATNKYYTTLLAELYLRDKKMPQAIKTYQELTKLTPTDPQPYLELANLYIQQNKFDDAIKAYDQIEKQLGITEEVSRQKQEIYLKTNQVEQAISEGKKLVAAFPNDVRYTLLLAEIYTIHKRTDDAVPLLQKIASGTEASPQARLRLSDIYRRQGKIQEADHEIEQAFANSTLDASVKVQILVNYIQLQRDEASRKTALKLANLIIQAHPSDAKAYAVYGDLLALSDQKENARNNYLKAARLDNSIYEVWTSLLHLDADLNQLDSLIKHSDRALEYFPNQGEIWYFNGYGYLLKKNYQKAVDALEEGKRLAIGNPKLLTDYNIMLGDAYHGNGEYARSDAAYEAVLADDPNNASALNNYSYYLSLRKQNLEKAKEMGKRLVEKNPTNASYLDTYAWVLYMLKEYKEARKYLEIASKDTNNGTILEHYGDVLYKMNETELAVEMWMKAKKAGETTETLDKKIAQRKLVE